MGSMQAEKPSWIKSQESAERILKGFFVSNPRAENVSVEEIYRVSRRDPEREKTNRSWLGNILSSLKYYDLVKPVYSYRGARKLSGLQLTDKGKEVVHPPEDQEEAIAGVYSPYSPVNYGVSVFEDKLSPQDLLNYVQTFRRQNPGLEVTFGIRVKDEG